jgi:hypothetical protein
MVAHIISQEPLVGESKRPLLRQLLQRLIAKQLEPQALHFDLLKVSCGHCIAMSCCVGMPKLSYTRK